MSGAVPAVVRRKRRGVGLAPMLTCPLLVPSTPSPLYFKHVRIAGGAAMKMVRATGVDRGSVALAAHTHVTLPSAAGRGWLFCAS